jgi:hypothetical protein
VAPDQRSGGGGADSLKLDYRAMQPHRDLSYRRDAADYTARSAQQHQHQHQHQHQARQQQRQSQSLFPPGIREEALPAINVGEVTPGGGGGGGHGAYNINAGYSNAARPGITPEQYMNSRLPTDGAEVVEHPVIPPAGAVDGDWEWIEAGADTRSHFRST